MMIQPQIDFCCLRLVAINIALTHGYKLVNFLNLIYSFIVNRRLRLLQPRLLSRQKFSFQTYIMVRKPALRTSATKWNRFMAPVSGECVICITL